MDDLGFRPTSDASEIQDEITRLTGETLNSTRRMVAAIQETEDVATNTLTQLSTQGDQLNKIEEDLHDAHEKVVDARQTLHKMNAFCWGIFSRFTKKPQKSVLFKKTGHNENDIGSEEHVPMLLDSSKPKREGVIAKIADTPEEHELEENLQIVENVTGKLHQMALNMESEIARQNEQLDRINALTEENIHGVTSASREASRLLN